jgi:uncharacterized membrane protein
MRHLPAGFLVFFDLFADVFGPASLATTFPDRGAHQHTVTMTDTAAEHASSSGRAAARRLAVMLLGVGTTHFLAPKPFDMIVPEELPGSARFYTYASGVAEVATGVALLVPRTRRLAGLAAVFLFLSVFPANVNMVRLWWSKPLAYRVAAIARLPLQIPMIAQALKVWRSA